MTIEVTDEELELIIEALDTQRLYSERLQMSRVGMESVFEVKATSANTLKQRLQLDRKPIISMKKEENHE